MLQVKGFIRTNFGGDPKNIKTTRYLYNIWIFEGASYIDEFGYLNELTSISQKNEKVDFTPTCSRPNDPKNVTWKGKTGRVNEIFNSICNLEKANKEIRNAEKIYLKGFSKRIVSSLSGLVEMLEILAPEKSSIA